MQVRNTSVNVFQIHIDNYVYVAGIIIVMNQIMGNSSKDMTNISSSNYNTNMNSNWNKSKLKRWSYGRIVQL